MKRFLILGVLISRMMTSVLGGPGEAFPLWPEGAPGARGVTEHDRPTLTPYPADPEKATGAAMIICPGGGYWGLAPHEGNDYALYLNRAGITCFVLKYRLAQHGYLHPSMMLDVNRAVRLVRSQAAKWTIQPGKVGVMGSSAGGHLASTAVTHFDDGQPSATDPVERMSSRPDLGVLCYPVITMTEFTHGGSRKNLLGTNPPPALVWLMSNETQVTPRTPPCFIWHTQEDSAVPVENALAFAASLQKAKVPFDLHVYEKGRHGIGLAAKPPEFENVHPWGPNLLFWLREQGFLK